MMRAAFELRGKSMHAQLSAIDGVTCLEPQRLLLLPERRGLLGRELGGRACTTASSSPITP